MSTRKKCINGEPRKTMFIIRSLYAFYAPLGPWDVQLFVRFHRHVSKIGLARLYEYYDLKLYLQKH